MTRIRSLILAVLLSSSLLSESLAAGDPLETWHQRNPLPSQEAAHAVVYGNGRWVAVGWYSLILTSPDGVDWTKQFLPSREYRFFESLSFAKDRFFVGSNDGFHDSADGITWTPHVFPPSSQGVSASQVKVVYLNGLFLALCSNELLYTSTDGLVWTLRHEPIDRYGLFNLYDAKFGNDVFVAIGSQGYKLVSSDGQNWNRIDPNGTADLLRLTYGDGVFLGSGRNDSRRIYSSADGVSWSDLGSLTNEVAGIVFADGEFIAVMERDKDALIAVSTNGTDWTQKGVATNIYPLSLGVSEGGFVLVGQAVYFPGQALAAAILTSPDGESWTRRESGVRGYLDDVTYGAGQFVAVGGLFSTNANVVTSPDGIHWTKQNIGTTNLLRRVAYGGGKYVIIGRDNISRATHPSPIFTSPDAVTWTKQDTSGGIRTFLNGIVHAEGAFVAVGFSNTVARSVDGGVWTSVALSETDHLWAVAHGNDRFVAVGEVRGATNPAVDNILTSLDGENWTRHSTGRAADLRVIAYGNGRFITVARGPVEKMVSFSSSDGMAWTRHEQILPSSLPPSGVPERLIFGGGRFIMAIRSTAGSNYSVVCSSTDGENWIQHITGSPWILYSLAYGRNSVVVAGDVGNLLQSGTFPRTDVFLTGRMIPGSGFEIKLSGGGSDFQLQRTVSLSAPEWETLGRFDSEGVFLDGVSQTGEPKFYRAVGSQM